MSAPGRTVQSRVPGILVATGAFILWSLAFLALYVAVSLGCAWGWDRPWDGAGGFGLSLQRLVALGVWGLHLLLLAGLLAWAWAPGPLDNGERQFRRVLAIGGAAFGLLATLWTGLPVFLASDCL
ncbi:hypothetical protein [Pseudoroseomonas sp. WGS1072]|uniref:hypothetical protein n=1 Tax=Roseomonas sp. WGS1072 TaxID=3366816 RepID=UPI003BF2B9E9